eukprot:Sspe_Gene.74052::Locus_45400_Transcript_1_1_Confidence_1.000_Length_751::g.74052::m.74052
MGAAISPGNQNCSSTRRGSTSSNNVEKRVAICRYWSSGYCRNGDSCRFLHRRATCRYWREGRCRYGSNCKFQHPKLEPRPDAPPDPCVVCLCNVKDHLVLPCRHLAFCRDCAQHFSKGDPCPMCRACIGTILTIYL